MNSNFLNMIGLGGIDAGYVLLGLLIISILLLILIIVAFMQISRFKKKYAKFMIGKDGSSLEQDIMTLYEDNKYIKLNVSQNRDDIKELFKKHETAFQKLGLVKYDAFKEMGGKLSFALVLLDGCYSYTKRIKNGDSEIELSNEEKVAVERAINGNASSDTE